jgi:hypothetical protein
MNVRSPIGDLPFVVTRLRRDGRELVIDGELGAWPSEVRMQPRDVVMLARACRTVLMIVGGGVVVAAAARRRWC